MHLLLTFFDQNMTMPSLLCSRFLDVTQGAFRDIQKTAAKETRLCPFPWQFWCWKKDHCRWFPYQTLEYFRHYPKIRNLSRSHTPVLLMYKFTFQEHSYHQSSAHQKWRHSNVSQFPFLLSYFYERSFQKRFLEFLGYSRTLSCVSALYAQIGQFLYDFELRWLFWSSYTFEKEKEKNQNFGSL